MVSTILAGLAGILIAPLFNVHSEMGTLFGIKAFAVAILGGMTSAWGVMLAGLAYGLIEAMVTAFFGSSVHADRGILVRHPGAGVCAQRLFGRAAVNKVERCEARPGQIRHAARHSGADGDCDAVCAPGQGYGPFILALVALTMWSASGSIFWSASTGQVSLGHVGFYAIGAYTAAILTLRGVISGSRFRSPA